MSENLFVYGTLRSDHPSGMHQLLKGKTDFKGYAVIQGKLLTGTDYPALIPSGDSSEGEVYGIRDDSLLEKIDRYEGEEYQRRKASVILKDGSSLDVWVYWFLP